MAVIEDPGKGEMIEKGFYLSEKNSPDKETTYKVEEKSDDNIYSYKVSGLVPNTTYSVRAYAKNRVGSEVTKLAFGGRKEFTTQSLKAPVVSEPTYDMDVDKMTLTVSAFINRIRVHVIHRVCLNVFYQSAESRISTFRHNFIHFRDVRFRVS